MAVAEEYIEHNPEYRHNNYRDYPRYLVAGVHVGVYDVKHHDKRNDLENIVLIIKRRAERPEQHHKVEHLQRNAYNAHGRAVENLFQRFDDKIHAIRPFNNSVATPSKDCFQALYAACA